jgi:hypothetical protein
VIKNQKQALEATNSPNPPDWTNLASVLVWSGNRSLMLCAMAKRLRDVCVIFTHLPCQLAKTGSF